MVGKDGQKNKQLEKVKTMGNKKISREEAKKRWEEREGEIEKLAENISEKILKEIKRNDYTSLDVAILMELINRAFLNQEEIKETKEIISELISEKLGEPEFESKFGKEELDYIR